MSFLALHEAAGEAILGGRAPGLSICGASNGYVRCWWLPHHHPSAHSWALSDADLRAIVTRQGILQSGLPMSDPPDIMSFRMDTPSHHDAASRALPAVRAAAGALEDAATQPGLHPCVATILADLASKTRTWAEILPHMTGLAREAPPPPTTKHPKPKKGPTA